MNFLLRIVINAVAVWAAVVFVDGVEVYADGPGPTVVTYLTVGAIFGLVNAIIRPVVRLLAFPLMILSLGLFALVVNALLFWLVSAFSDALDVQFEVTGFGPAFWGALIVGVVSWFLSLVLGEGD